MSNGNTVRAFDAVAESLGGRSGAEPAPPPDKSDSIKELAGALAKAQAEIRGAAKDAVNPGFRSRYATLSAVWDACRAQLTGQGLAVAQMPRMVGSQLMLETRLMHVSGEWLSSWWPINPVKNDPQGLGSALTYARRYALSAMVGVAPDDDDDDDGQEASGHPTSRQSTSKAQPAAPSAELQRVLGMIAAAPDRYSLSAMDDQINAVRLNRAEINIVQGAITARVKGFEGKDRTEAQRAEIRAGMRKAKGE